MLECACYRKGVLEVKCPYRLREESSLDEAENLTNLCLTRSHDGNLELKQDAYFYQCQMQMAVTQTTHCILWYGHHLTYITWSEL